MRLIPAFVIALSIILIASNTNYISAQISKRPDSKIQIYDYDIVNSRSTLFRKGYLFEVRDSLLVLSPDKNLTSVYLINYSNIDHIKYQEASSTRRSMIIGPLIGLTSGLLLGQKVAPNGKETPFVSALMAGLGFTIGVGIGQAPRGVIYINKKKKNFDEHKSDLRNLVDQTY